MAEENVTFSTAGLALLTANLGFYGTDIPEEMKTYLQSLMGYALNDFANMGIRLTPGQLNDDMDQMIYAAYLYRKGVSGEGKNEMLKAIIRNRQVRNALADGEGSA